MRRVEIAQLMIVIVILAVVLFLGIGEVFPEMGNIKTALIILLALSAVTGLVTAMKKDWLIAAPCILWAILLFMFTLIGPSRAVAVMLLVLSIFILGFSILIFFTKKYR